MVAVLLDGLVLFHTTDLDLSSAQHKPSNSAKNAWQH